MLIYKILRAAEWADLQNLGETQGAPVDVADGYIHFSTAEQARETAAKHFAGENNLMLLAYDSDQLGDAMKWEKSRNDQLFPHLYAPLRHDQALWARPLPLGPDGHEFPEGFA
ncbi:MAG: DUF952 domain-containing protein [Pseudomonadota bacterium]|nr:DUF952 domain-containing protein [Pseudomonadota bacterium]MEC8580070.1 DUF952 domain-containing protein [Pseudomonadota bacterium]